MTLQCAGLTIEDELYDYEEAKKILVGPVVSYDFIACFLGKKLGYGCYRAVYDYNLSEKKRPLVLKIEPGFTNCNVTEAAIWNEVYWFQNELAWVKDWFAPVEWISPNGKVLCMHKTEPRPAKKRPTKVPHFLSDIKDENFGWIGNKFVCHDYGQLWNITHYHKRFKPATWIKHD